MTLSALGSMALQPRPLINKPFPLNRDYNRDPSIKALKGGGLFIMGLHYSIIYYNIL